MSCSNTLYSVAMDCGSLGGIREAYIAAYKDGAFVMASGGTYTGETEAVVSDIDSGITFQRLEFRKGSSTLTQTGTVDVATGVNQVSAELQLVFARQQTASRIAVNAMLKTTGAIVVVKDANGEYLAMGQEEPVLCSAATGAHGTQRTDANNYTITLKDDRKNFLPFLTDAAIEKLKAQIAE